MKNKILIFLTIVVLLGVSAFATLLQKQLIPRFHQHLQAQTKPPCSHTSGELCTHLPIISINTNSQELHFDTTHLTDVSNEVTASISTFDNPDKNNHISDSPKLESLARIKYRGNSSIHFDKKSYKLNFINKDFSENKDCELLGMPKHDEWVLNGPFLDKTLIRNYLCMNISGEIMYDTPEVRFCELVVNGKYQGVYLAMESIAKGKERVDISSYKKGEFFTSYILRADRKLDMPAAVDNFTSYTRRMSQNTALEVIYPIEANTDEKLMKYIEQDFSKFEKALYSFDYNDMIYGYRKSTNAASFIDYFIINEFFKNYDAGSYSTYFYKDIKGKISIGPVWDFNNSCNNYMETVFDETGLGLMDRTRYFMLFKDESFVNTLIARYKSLRKSSLNEQYLCDYIDKTVAYLGSAVDRNFDVWGYSFYPYILDERDRLDPMERNPTSYKQAVEQLKDYIIARGRWMDKNIDNLRQYSHESKNKKFNK